MRKLVTSLAAVTAVAAGAAVLLLKMTVQERVDDIRAVVQKIHNDEEAIRVLEAEWAYLTTPQLLQDRSIQFLALMPPKAKQVLYDPVVIPYRPRGIDVKPKDAGVVLLPAVMRAAQKTVSDDPLAGGVQ